MKKHQKSYQKINPVVRWIMILSLMIVFFTLLVSWILWLLIYRNIIEAMLINLSFINFSIIVLIFSGLALLFALPLIVLSKKNITTNVFSLLSFILSLTLASTNLLLYHNFKVNNFSIVFIPWAINAIATICLFISSSINLIIVKEKINQVIKMPIELATINQIKSSNTIVNDATKISQLKEETDNFNNLPIIKEQIQFHDKKSIIAKDNLLTTEIKWTKKQIKEIWEKADIIPGVNKDLYRKDYAGAWMFFPAFINTSDETEVDVRNYSWTITTHKPTSQSIANNPENLIPMNFINAITKGQNYPKWKTKISSWGNENIIKEQIWSD